MSAQLEVTSLSVHYGGVVAVDSLSMKVSRGQVVGLIGPNGAGKTTVIDALSGAVSSRGKIVFGGHDISQARADRRARLGLARTWQAVELFDDMTVRENLLVSSEAAKPWWSLFGDVLGMHRDRAVEGVERALDLLGIAEFADRTPTELSHGQSKLVGIARALASDPAAVLLDEPAAGLDSDETGDLGEHLRRVADGGIAVLLIDHDVNLVSSVCDYLYVLDFGKLLAEGRASEVLERPEVTEAYLGTSTTPSDGQVS